MCIIEVGMLGITSAAGAAAANAAVVSLVTTGVTMAAQQQQASAQNRMMAERQRQGTALARENYAAQQIAAVQRTAQEREAAANEIGKIESDARKATALAQLSAIERGVAGQSVDQIYSDFTAQELRYQTNVRKNLSFREQAIQDNLNQARMGMASNIANLQFMPRSGPNLLAGALQIGGAAFNAYQNASFFGPNPRTTPQNAADPYTNAATGASIFRV